MNTLYNDFSHMLNAAIFKRVFIVPAFATTEECLDWVKGEYSKVAEVLDWMAWYEPKQGFHYFVLNPPISIAVVDNDDEDALMFKLRWSDYIA
ncbi:hypothetical protein MCEMIH16_02723 [Caulobacteraceae bacterium]